MDYEVKLESFQGPLELLYQVVKKNEIEINNISLARITEQYLEYTDHFRSFDLDIATEFTVIASELIELKANSLLPKKENEEEEEQSNIVQRLREYHIFKRISNILKKQEENASKIFFRPKGVSSLIVEDYELDLEIEINELKKAFIDAYKSTQEEENEKENDLIEEELNYLEQENFKIEDKIEEIIQTLKKSVKNIYFYHLVNNREENLEIVVTLLSILELVKLKEVKVEQKSLFEDIKIFNN